MATSSQLQRIAEAFGQLENRPHKTWLRNADAATAFAYVEETIRGKTPSSYAIVDGVFVMYSIGRPWWAARDILAEELMLRIEPGAGVTAALSFLERTAELLNCAGVVLGTSISTNDAALVRLYRQHGYVESANVLYKEV